MARRRQNRSNKKSSSKNKPIVIKEIAIDSLAHDGRGVGRDTEGKVVFVDGALPDETVSYSELESRKKFSKGTTVEVIEKSAHRVEPKCEVFGKCGGCALQHLSADQQIIYKQQHLLENLEKIGEVTPEEEVLAPITGDAWSYRRRSRFGATFAQTKNEVRLGFRARNTHFIQPTKTCEIVDQRISNLLPDLKIVLSQLRCNENIKGVDLCVADSGLSVLIIINEFMNSDDARQLVRFAKSQNLQLRIQHDKEPEQFLFPKELDHSNDSSLLSYHFNNLDGFPDIDIAMEFAAKDFTQVNPEVNTLLVTKLLELSGLSSEDRVLDLFCGIGNFSLPLATQALHVTGVEGSANSIERANHNRDNNQFENIDFYDCDLFDETLFSDDEWLEDTPEKLANASWLNQQFDMIVLDPPRAGAINIVQHIDRFAADKIIYISCDPATLARDTKILVSQHGYILKTAGVADMFPQTAHVESIAVFER